MRTTSIIFFIGFVSAGILSSNAVAQFSTGDRIIKGSLGVGLDSEETTSFGFDTIRLRENNLQIHFDDTSASSGFPANDWRIVINDRNQNGSNFFAVEDSTAAVVPFRIQAGAAADSLVVADGGDIGIGTEMPLAPLHVARTGIFDEAKILVENDKTPAAFRQLFELKNNGGVQFLLTNSDLGEVWKFTTDTINRFTITRDGTGGPEFSIFQDGRVIMGGGPSINFDLDASGNLEISGALSEMSDKDSKENFADLDSQSVLEKVVSLPITTWNYKDDSESTRHIGPTSQDFYEAFELGDDPTKIASMDRTGVALVSIQALNTQMETIKEKQNEIERLNHTVDELNDRLSKIEALLSRKDL